jgi:hypothetical protein
MVGAGVATFGEAVGDAMEVGEEVGESGDELVAVEVGACVGDGVIWIEPQAVSRATRKESAATGKNRSVIL